MAVPAHDARDYDFAQQFGLPIVRVVECGDLPFTESGKAVNSSNEASGLDINGLSQAEAVPKVFGWLEAKGLGEKKINYKLRDWLFARQRYWGEPFPVMYAEGSLEPIPVPEEELPLILPKTDNFKPGGMGAANVPSFTPGNALHQVVCPCPLTLLFATLLVPAGQSPLANIKDWMYTTDPVSGKPCVRDTNTMPQWAGSCWYYLRFIDPKNKVNSSITI